MNNFILILSDNSTHTIRMAKTTTLIDAEFLFMNMEYEYCDNDDNKKKSTVVKIMMEENNNER